MIYKPHDYQIFADQHIMDNPAAGLFLDMGLGKTVTTLTALDRLIYMDLEISKPLIIAPLKIAESTWHEEAKKWDHLKHLTFSLILGDVKQRKKALAAKADIYVINRDNVPWLCGLYGAKCPFDMIVIDELSSFKNNDAVRFKALRKWRPFVKRIVGLTGTPAPNGLIDLWSQLYLLDMGERLGKTITGYREAYFTKKGDYGGYKVRNGCDKEISGLIEDICISMRAVDHLDLPKRVDVDMNLHMSDKLLKQYKAFEEEKILELAEAEEITAVNAGALYTKLRQFAGGAIYDEDGNTIEIHDEKIEALGELLEAAQGQPFLCLYAFKHDLARIDKKLKQFKPVKYSGKADLDRWNAGKIPFLLGHPASMGHGLNMQAGGHLMGWFNMPTSLEQWLQAIARLDRQGQLHTVTNTKLVMCGTVDEEIARSTNSKTDIQNSHVNIWRYKYFDILLNSETNLNIMKVFIEIWIVWVFLLALVLISCGVGRNSWGSTACPSTSKQHFVGYGPGGFKR
jgi:SNF2 family DNA or RNA helicase